MKVNDTYINKCDDQQITITVLAIEGDNVTVLSSYQDRNWTMPIVHFEAVMGVMGFTLQEQEVSDKYRLFIPKYNGYSEIEFETCNQAIELGKHQARDFQVELGSMVCCRWTLQDGLIFTSQYRKWQEDQQKELARVRGDVE
jgi:uncharacterized protein YukJ